MRLTNIILLMTILPGVIWRRCLMNTFPKKKTGGRIIYFIPLILILAGLLFFVNYSKRTAPSRTCCKNRQTKSLLKDTEGNLPSQHSANIPDGYCQTSWSARKKEPLRELMAKTRQSKETQSNLAEESTSGIPMQRNVTKVD